MHANIRKIINVNKMQVSLVRIKQYFFGEHVTFLFRWAMHVFFCN